jgi:D-alanyl-D-alanine carboxypeptidase
MIPSQPLPTRARPTRSTILAVLGLIATVAVGVVAVSPADFTHDDASAPAHPGAAETSATPTTRVSMVPAGHSGRKQRTQTTSLADEGAVRGAVTVFDDRSAAVANLDPALLSALREAAKDADDDGVEFLVNSGWRSAAYQDQLLQEAVAEYGSEKEAARWVATPETSAHVSGDAVDLGPSDATSWLSHRGAAYGLCQIYRNEPWHYELRPGAVDHGCPATYADPTQDPRMQQ